MNFYKIGEIEHIPDFGTGTAITRFGEVADGKFKGINYSSAFINFTNALNALVPRFAFDTAEKTLMTINREVPPHTDSNIECAINIYLQTSNCLTQFYDVKGDEQLFQIENQTNGFIFLSECLEPADSFVAKPGDVYLLNVRQPHSVIPRRPGPIDRKALCLQSKAVTFKEALSWFERA